MAGGEEDATHVVMRCYMTCLLNLRQHRDLCDPAGPQPVVQGAMGFSEDE